MRKRIFLTAIVGIIATLGVAQADAADRFFQIKVKQIAGGTSDFYEPPSPPGPNCYSFFEDGTWIDPLFFNPVGTWETTSEGAVTRYTARAEFIIPGVVSIVLVQNGKFTPAFSKGQVRLQAFSTAYINGEAVAEFMSTGYEAEGCP